jgi:putative Ca2+/H+ antiporter (TMEM165/GDT1 family)
MFYLLLATYGTIFLSELLGDKSIYTISSLTVRFRALYVFYGFTVAFMLKMFAAVLLGQVIAQLPKSLVAFTSTTTFLVTALVIWFRKEDDGPVHSDKDTHFAKAALITFAAVFFSEWGDIGQVMAATLTARYQLPLVVWLGATLALITKGLLALALGRGLRKRIPLHILRPVSAGLCVVMGAVSAIGPMFNSR